MRAAAGDGAPRLAKVRALATRQSGAECAAPLIVSCALMQHELRQSQFFFGQ